MIAKAKMKILKLNITQKNIDDAIAYSGEDIGSNCPVANCAKDLGLTNPFVSIEFGTGKVVIFYNEDNELAIDSQVLRTYIDNFDDGYEVLPLNLELEID